MVMPVTGILYVILVKVPPPPVGVSFVTYIKLLESIVVIVKQLEDWTKFPVAVITGPIKEPPKLPKIILVVCTLIENSGMFLKDRYDDPVWLEFHTGSSLKFRSSACVETA
jgi:hypothetical protein